MILSSGESFIEFCYRNRIIELGEFRLKSGRKSPYFFNTGRFKSGKMIKTIGENYAKIIVENRIEFNNLFGAAYKGIPLVVATVISLSNYSIDKPYSFNRKLKKEYGDQGEIVGSKPQGRVLLIDDVITKGITIRNIKNLLSNYNANLAGIIIAFDRQEKIDDEKISASEKISQEFKMPIFSIATLKDLINYLEKSSNYTIVNKIKEYYAKYGI